MVSFLPPMLTVACAGGLWADARLAAAMSAEAYFRTAFGMIPISRQYTPDAHHRSARPSIVIEPWLVDRYRTVAEGSAAETCLGSTTTSPRTVICVPLSSM